MLRRRPLNVLKRPFFETMFSTNNLLLVAIANALVAVVSAQIDSTNTQDLCTGLSSNANATGEQPINRLNADGTSNTLGQWKVSVRSNYAADIIESAESTANASNPNAVANVWLDPFVGIDLNSGEVFSACAYLYKDLPRNTLLRGQGDDTTCEQMLSRKCVEEITMRAATTAQWLVQNPTLGPSSNLTVNSPTVPKRLD